MQVTSSEFHKQSGFYYDQALLEPVFVTRNGRERTVLMSMQEYRRLYKLARRNMPVTELTDEEVDEIASSEMSPEYAHLDSELN